MFGLPAIIITFAVGDSLCRGPWMHADAVSSFRGVAVEENGLGRCCALADDPSFVCEMTPGHQHEAIVENHLRFYDGKSARPRVDLVVRAAPNPGMRPNPNPPPPFASLRLSATADGFELLPHEKTSCEKPRGAAKEVCANAGRWFLVDGIAKRR